MGGFHRAIGIEKKDINRAEVGERITLVYRAVVIEWSSDRKVDDPVAVEVARRTEALP